MTDMLRLPIDPGFETHLEHLGISLGRAGTFEVHRDTLIEPPVALLGCDIWRDRVEIGAFTYFGPDSIFANATIGRYCSLAERVQIGMTQHPADWLTTSPIPYVANFMNFERHFANADLGWSRELPLQDYDLRPATTIGNDVWIGTGVYVKDGVTIGDGAIVGAHSVVTKDVPPYAIVVGSPARVLRYRFDDAMIERLQALRWWNYNILEFGGWDVRNVEGAVGALEDAIAAGLVHPYTPPAINLLDEYGRYVRIRAMLQAQAA